MITNQGINVIIAVIGLFSEIHNWNRSNIALYREVFLDVPKDELVRRDPKGIYKKFREGKLSNVVGFDIEVDFPIDPDFHFKWSPGQKVVDLSRILMEDFLAHKF
jgi:adenylylsulfate kinase